ncbi:MAG: hypothetical protein NVS1B5_20240 [Gemmatimonadaceae bacterium]
MLAIRCTKKLLDRMQVDPDPNPPTCSTVLGDWYANLLRVSKQQFILCVSEKTLLPVLLPAVAAKLLPRRLPEAAFDVLKRLGIPGSAIDREMREMQDAVVARTASRSVLGMMNDFAFAAPYRLVEGASLVEVALWLAETPCSPIDMNSPDRETQTAFAESLH